MQTLKLYDRDLQFVTVLEQEDAPQTVEHDGRTFNQRAGYPRLYDEIDAHTPASEAKRAADETPHPTKAVRREDTADEG